MISSILFRWYLPTRSSEYPDFSFITLFKPSKMLSYLTYFVVEFDHSKQGYFTSEMHDHLELNLLERVAHSLSLRILKSQIHPNSRLAA